jgi:ribonuclease HII
MLKAYHTFGNVEAGVDEAGRGCLAGPVVAAAVILPENFYHPLLNDSKQVSEKDRSTLRGIIESHAIAYSVAFISAEVIDKINILQASFQAMNDAVNKLKVIPKMLLIDGNRFRNTTKIEHLCIIKGDGIYASIAAASILAKTYRDEYMLNIHEHYQQYGWDKNKGYPTKIHRAAILDNGTSEHHRKTFRLLKANDIG